MRETNCAEEVDSSEETAGLIEGDIDELLDEADWRGAVGSKVV